MPAPRCLSRAAFYLGVLCTSLLPVAATAQKYPTDQITIVVGVAAGSVTDAVARLISVRLAERFRIPVIVDNKPGAAQLIGINAVKGKAPDGKLLLFITGSAIGQAPAFRKDLPYDPLKDFTFVARSTVSPGVIAVRNGLPAANVRELIEHARRNPGALNYGSAGAGNAGHVQMEYFNRRTGTSMTHVPFKSDNQIALELAEGRLDVCILTAAAAKPLAQAGKLRILAVTSKASVPFLPGVPNLREIGVPEIEGMDPFTFFGLVGPAGMAPDLVRLINTAHNDAMRDPKLIQTLRDSLSSEAITESPEEFRQFVAQELEKWGQIGKGLKLD